MKKLMMVFALVLVGTTAANARIGLGIVFEGGHSWSRSGVGGFGGGLSLAFGEIEKVGLELGIRFWGSSNNGFVVGVDADWHLFQIDFTEWMGFYIGAGPYVGLNIRGNNNNTRTSRFGLDVGLRVPVGLRFFLANHFDIWIAFVPKVGFGMRLENNNDWFGLAAGVGGEIGFRFWF